MLTLERMDAKKKSGVDRHKATKMVRIREALADPLEQYADSIASTATEVVNAAIREKLAGAGFWPPKKTKGS